MKIVAIIPNREEFLACEVLKGLHRRGVELIPSSPLSNIRNAYARCSPISIGAEDIPDTKGWKYAIPDWYIAKGDQQAHHKAGLDKYYKGVIGKSDADLFFIHSIFPCFFDNYFSKYINETQKRLNPKEPQKDSKLSLNRTKSTKKSNFVANW